MKTLKSILLTTVLVNTAKAQDVITKNDSSKITAAIIEISPTTIKYKLYNYADGPTIIANKEEVAYIIYKNGITEKFSKPTFVKPTKTEAYDPNTYNLDRISVSIYNPEAKTKKCEKLYAKKII
jgi:hypothetical protein